MKLLERRSSTSILFTLFYPAYLPLSYPYLLQPHLWIICHGGPQLPLQAQFYPDEQLLCGPNYGMSGDTWDPIGAFQRLPQQ